MKTNCIVIEGLVPEKVEQEIVFEYYIDNNQGRIISKMQPKEYENIELIARGYYMNSEIVLDLMFAYDDLRFAGILYLGKWNDGIVIND